MILRHEIVGTLRRIMRALDTGNNQAAAAFDVAPCKKKEEGNWLQLSLTNVLKCDILQKNDLLATECTKRGKIGVF